MVIPEYFKERENLETVLNDKFFFMYRIEKMNNQNIFFVHTMFIKKSERLTQAFKEMFQIGFKIVHDNDCKIIICNVQIDDENHPKLLSLYFKMGFEIYKTDNKTLYLKSNRISELYQKVK